ncbi:MAG: KpsF/GutQ family sugar-phosphate isomerase [Lentisphaerae bacterium]|nr:KpsF/GutQ family sugar-phosphate isomerase [Lentisphaerota bacterium]
MSEKRDALTLAKEVFDIELEGIAALRDELDESFVGLVDRCAAAVDAGGKIVLTGVGKSGYIGKKIAATLSSVGNPAVFMHPVEARHGDLGLLQKNDLLIALSYSGETEELLVVLTPAKRLGVELAAITGNRESSLGQMSDFVLEMPVPREACPFNLAPTTTTSALLVLGDALAMVLLDRHGFTKSDYGRRHPGGAIGRMVTMKACDVMRKAADAAVVSPDATVRETLYAMSHARSGAAVIADADMKLLGIFTDGDFRRSAAKDDLVLTKPVSLFMTPDPVNVRAEAQVVEVIKLVEKRRIDDLVVVDETGKVAGIIDIQDLPGLKLM